ncbi:A24 family peptidase [Cupriavidus pauculus]|uniref:Precorrin-2 dehydrogenase n=1 Tax=Cupriavidus pauculus TaxID=82633 RepID=A0A3G8GVW1_9BURK|nr:prepilin peptidase [Cupriavidus pauculus]AZG12347.1 precorrin-2 dehydrogenase [Cupriavidus pauculus]
MTTTITALANLSLAAMVTVAAIGDARTRRIPNWLVASGMVLALAAQIATLGPRDGSLHWLAGLATGMGIFLAVYLLGGMGAGDVKLMGAVGAFMGPLGGAHVAVVSFLVGGVLALAAMAIHRESRRTLASLSGLLLALPFGRLAAAAARRGPAAGATAQQDKADGAKHAAPASQTSTGKAARLPYAVAIAAGTLLVKWEVL